jgi:hypothetical protein
MIKVAKKKHLKNIEIEVNKDGGFCIWVYENVKVNGKKQVYKHWILDGSCIKENGKIKLGSPHLWKINAKFEETENAIYVTSK